MKGKILKLKKKEASAKGVVIGELSERAGNVPCFIRLKLKVLSF